MKIVGPTSPGSPRLTEPSLTRELADVVIPIRQSLHSCTGTTCYEKPSLTFVTISNPEEAKDSTNRFLVRSSALKSYRAKKRQQRSVTQKVESANRLESRNRIMQHLLHPNPKTILNAGRDDPFSTYPRPLTSHEHQLLDHFITGFCPKHDPLFPAEFSNAASTIWLPEAVKEQGLLDGILLLSGRDLMQVAPNKELGSLIFQLRGRLIREVKDAIGDKRRAIKHESMGTLLGLAFDELATGNWEDLSTHLKGLKLIIQLRNGLSTTGFQGFLCYLMARIDLVSTIHKQLASPHDSDLKPKNAPSIENLNSDFLAIAILRNLSAEMITILNFFTALTTLLAEVPGAALPPLGSYAVEESFSDHEAEWRLLSLGIEKATALFEEPDIQRCIVFAAGVYRSRILYENYQSYFPSPCSMPQMEKYKAGILRLGKSSRRSHYLPLILWMAFMGCLAVTPIPIGSYWPQLIDEVAKELRIKTWDEARLILKRFLWSDRRCEVFGRDLWEHIQKVATHT